MVSMKHVVALGVGVTTLSALPLVSSAAPITMSDLNPFRGISLFVSSDSPARQQAEALRKDRPQDAVLLELIAAQPVATWFGDWNRSVEQDVAREAERARRERSVLVFVAYNIPNRDCGSYSAGGSADAASYGAWIDRFARGLGQGPAIVVLEPDALAGIDCLAPEARTQRLEMLRKAVHTLSDRGASVYIDAGHARWHSAPEMSNRLREAGIDRASGFALNVSNFHPTGVNVRYGEALSRELGGKGFVIDTSRNGVGTASPEDWCNPSGQGLGALPTTDTGNPLVHALLWIKRPGESDGTCNGGPAAGQWWTDYALELARRHSPQLALGR